MVIEGGEPVFLDTNILVYASQIQSPFHQVAMEAIQGFYDAGVELWISRQVLREYLATFTRPQQFANPLPIAIVIQDLRYFYNRFRVAEDNSQVTERLLTLMEEISSGGKQVHDANIVATMLVYGIPQLLTHNISDFARFSGLITVLPLQG
ncbi:PIN domain-containing protein [Nostoc sp. NMS8]|uniref:type II toxin-antitoxin system VapC family toxin n=1 Tax=Nostoc sp. NMS8 TaxID=2815392 RepID=UPI0025FD19CF|nr:PIN domain-containing protein [Nostoc sp. NMS8]MBN3962222.1 PIN domain-containing protein [Nostoc sp. NMS8]